MASLAGGPVGPSDMIGTADAQLLMATWSVEIMQRATACIVFVGIPMCLHIVHLCVLFHVLRSNITKSLYQNKKIKTKKWILVMQILYE